MNFRKLRKHVIQRTQAGSHFLEKMMKILHFHGIMICSLKLLNIAEFCEIHKLSLILVENAPWPPRAESALKAMVWRCLFEQFWVKLSILCDSFFLWFWWSSAHFTFSSENTISCVFAISRASGSGHLGPRSATETRTPELLHYKRGDLGARRESLKSIPWGKAPPPSLQ